ncbi:MAG: 1-acyl-sn-glycerol-3-phosphate acyltransferase [bacterium]|jgi:1-acyl-sn-glycerol-3-phosphate acyltransferase|nr:1-acyl-sn-glycerol-3-phosphate acyltransferase [bacterium]
MRRVFRLVGFLAVNLFFLVLAMLAAPIALLFGRINHRKLVTFLTKVWANLNTFVLGIKVNLVNGDLIEQGQNYFIIGNHLSYLDIILVGCKRPGLFVGKKEVRSWPLLGQLAWLGGTIFVDRSQRGPTATKPYIGQIAKYLKQGLTILIFPEGTSSNGEGVLPFKKGIFSSPILAEIPILPITIRYTSVNGKPFGPDNCDLVTWHSDMTFVDHFWGVLNLKGFEVDIIINPPLSEKLIDEKTVLEQAKKLAERTHDIIERTYLKTEV